MEATDQGDTARKWCNDCEDFNPTAWAISGKDFLLIAEIIPKCKYLKDWLYRPNYAKIIVDKAIGSQEWRRSGSMKVLMNIE